MSIESLNIWAKQVKVNMDSNDDKGRSALSWAAENGREAVVRLLDWTGGRGVLGLHGLDTIILGRARRSRGGGAAVTGD